MINVQKAEILAVIPARFASTRFPGKPLAMIQGQSMITRVLQQVLKSERVQAAIVATDDARIFDHVTEFGGQAMMTKSEHPSGTDRCAEVARAFPEAKIILNVQGDEPFVQPEQIDLLAETLMQQPGYQIATLAKKITDQAQLFNGNVVKAAMSLEREALYFSRHPIPFLRGQEPDCWLEAHTYYKHIGLYAFRRDILQAIAALSPTPLEKAESLEQLRWLENGMRITVGITEMETSGVDVPEDILLFDPSHPSRSASM
jgi:3-deoxy-manno-octulosonate cytidylyltransferase (CMP-KDO synthetase)